MRLKATIRLTPTQKKQLEPLFEEVNKAACASTDDNDQRGAILGQAFGANDTFTNFYFLNHQQYQIVNRALTRALKLEAKRNAPARDAEIPEAAEAQAGV